MSLASVGEGSTGNEGSRRLVPTFNLVGVSGVCIARSLMQGAGEGPRKSGNVWHPVFAQS